MLCLLPPLCSFLFLSSPVGCVGRDLLAPNLNFFNSALCSFKGENMACSLLGVRADLWAELHSSLFHNFACAISSNLLLSLSWLLLLLLLLSPSPDPSPVILSSREIEFSSHKLVQLPAQSRRVGFYIKRASDSFLLARPNTAKNSINISIIHAGQS